VRIGLLTREWPPDIYGGAGVHVAHLVRELRRLADVDVHCFGASRDGAHGHSTPDTLASANPALQALGVDLPITAAVVAVLEGRLAPAQAVAALMARDAKAEAG
jgi:starch synthase